MSQLGKQRKLTCREGVVDMTSEGGSLVVLEGRDLLTHLLGEGAGAADDEDGQGG